MESHHLIYRVLSLVAVVIVVDVLMYLLLRPMQGRIFQILRRIHFSLSIGYGILLFSYAWLAGLPGLDAEAYRLYFFFTGLFVLIWIPRLLFNLAALPLLVVRYFRNFTCRRRIDRLLLSIYLLGIVLILYGTFIGRSQFIVREHTLSATALNNALPPLRIAQISDLHIGSFGNPKSVRKGLQILQEQKADIIVLTGDLINVAAEEAWPYEADFSALEAPLGKYAILGNHDIGDYLKGDTIRPPEINRRMLRAFFEKCGFILLEDSAVILQHQGQAFALAGVDNWGLPPFRKEGDLQGALAYTNALPVILLSHDPTHWGAEVLQYPQVILTLSGHTHGAQIGLYNRWFRWSPVQYKYPKWGGMYEENGRYLHVNTGFGFIGIPMRIGMWPEISLLRISDTEQNKQ